MAWVRQYSEPNVVGARKLRALVFYIKSTFIRQTATMSFEPLFGGSRTTYARERKFQEAKVPGSELARVL